MSLRTRLKGILTAAALILLLASANAAQPDGPYVLQSASGGWEAVSVEATAEGARMSVRAVAGNESLVIAGVGRAPSFRVKLRAAEPDSPDTVTTAKGASLFVVADTHGEHEILVAMLRAHKVLGPKLEWRFGRGHLVVLGDVFDRGPNHLEILWLLYQLQAEARKAGGGAHLVLGNHEAMVLRGDLRYLHEKYLDTTRVFGLDSYSRLFAAETVLGQWLRSRPAMLRVNDLLCLHAGVSRALVDSTLTLAEVNAAVRGALHGQAGGAGTELILGNLGPLWYRGYFAGQRDFPMASAGDVDLALKTYGARRLLIGHTIVPTVTPLYGGRVIAVQVYPRRDESGNEQFEALLMRNGEPWRATLDGGLQRLNGASGS